MVRLMVGRDLSQHFPHKPHPPGDVVLEVRDIRTSMYPKETVRFSVRAGEIVGIAGLVGAGRSEVLRAIFGVDKPLSGDVAVNGNTVKPGSPVQAIRRGVALVPEDRKAQGLFLEMAVRENLGLPSLRVQQRAGVVNASAERRISAEAIKQLAIKTPSDRQIAQYLSGGNQQKIVLGKWLALDPRVLLLDEPTRGIDVGAKREIYQLMESLARRGVAICFVSSEMEEVLGMSDRVIVMHEGEITGELTRNELSEESVLRLATASSAVVA
jgi:ribose transport system ATP-binding protein